MASGLSHIRVICSKVPWYLPGPDICIGPSVLHSNIPILESICCGFRSSLERCPLRGDRSSGWLALVRAFRLTRYHIRSRVDYFPILALLSTAKYRKTKMVTSSFTRLPSSGRNGGMLEKIWSEISTDCKCTRRYNIAGVPRLRLSTA